MTNNKRVKYNTHLKMLVIKKHVVNLFLGFQLYEPT